jgi:hypothetical protein
MTPQPGADLVEEKAFDMIGLSSEVLSPKHHVCCSDEDDTQIAFAATNDSDRETDLLFSLSIEI